MGKRKRILTDAEKTEKKKNNKEFMTVFINGKQKRIRRPPTIDGMDMDEFICRNADPIFLHQNEMWDYEEQHEGERCDSEGCRLKNYKARIGGVFSGGKVQAQDI